MLTVAPKVEKLAIMTNEKTISMVLGRLKSAVYVNRPGNIDELKDTRTSGCATINPAVLKRVQFSCLHRCC
jgi:hypothetical protein